MTEEIRNIVTRIDSEIRQNAWFEFHVSKFDGYKLSVAGSIDLIYYHNLEIIFEDVFFVSAFFHGWHSDTTKRTFFLPDNEKEYNEKYEIEQGYQIFIFKTENHNNDVIIAAKKLTYNTNTVYYYDKKDI